MGCCAIAPSPGVLAPLAVGSALMVFAGGGHLSGGHYNPAVTLGAWLRGRCPAQDVLPYFLPYWIAPVAGAVLGSVAAQAIKGSSSVTRMAVAAGPAFLAEFLFTLALVYVVLNSATAKATAGNSFYGLAIGITVMVGASAVGSISGGAFNPAVAVGLGWIGLVAWPYLGLYWVAELLAGACAAWIFLSLNPDDR
ncbi:Glycerol uptake facilitator or related permease (Major Intrinsic Protein Family) [Methylacidimicrobium sp. AP8]|uniref:aquaporin n=1 Tax=Methylacidimicrobium sp. AP8 TaxID=2730359 RepID=UPI0018BFA8AC|nr:Glycerol uptake facilitator or related permease (Major Intrinsic Protein Family) [Methylacidimicrobium sp. AP8]